MLARLQFVALSMIAIAIAYGGYSLVVAPLVEPAPPVRRTDTTSDEDIARARAEALTKIRDRFRDLFQANDWELESPKMIESKQVVMLMKDYKTLPDGRLELKPCTLIFYSQGVPMPGQPAPRAIVMQAPEGAILEFENGLDLRQGRMGRLVGGLLSGQITVRGRESQPGAGDDIELITKNVQMDAGKVWTPHEVSFRFGPNYGTGRDLEIQLTQRGQPNDLAPAAPGTPSGIKSIELVHVDRFHFDVSGRGLVPKEAIAKKDGEQGEAKRVRALMPGLFPMPSADAGEAAPPLEITCKGPFVFDFVERVARFEDRVDVFRVHANGPSDQLSCRLLEILFDEKASATKKEFEPKEGLEAKQEIAAKSEQAKAAAIMPKLQVKLLRAKGTPVTIRAPSVFAEARAEEIEYDFVSGTIRFDDPNKLQLRHGQRELEAKRLEYTAGADGKIGRLWALGPGKVRGKMSETSAQDFEVRWGKHLLFRPHEGSHLLSLIEQAGVLASDAGTLLSQEIHVWLREGVLPEGPARGANAPAASDVVRPPNAAPAPAPAPAPVAPNKREPRIGLVPDRVLATGDVHLDSAQLIATTKRLELWIEERAAMQSVIRPASWNMAEPASGGGVTRPPAARPSTSLAASPQQFSLTGELMRLLIVRRGGDSALEDLTVEGKAELQEVRTGKPGEVPMVAKGNILQLLKASGPDAALSLFGAPAEIRGRGFGLMGERIQARRQTSRIWIDGPGQMMLPGGQLMPGQAKTRPSQFLIGWRGKLDFNGQRMMCDGGVSLQGESQIGSCKILEAYLDRALDLTQLSPDRDTQLSQVTLVDDVILENRTIEGGTVTGIDHLQLPRLSMDQKTGLLSGQGPGFVTSVRRGNATSAFAPQGTAAPAPPVQAGSGLVFLRVDFQRGLSGTMQTREMKFLDQVRAVYGPVSDWKQTLAYESAAQSSDAVRLRCNELSVMEMGAPGTAAATRKPFELAAIGDTLVEGRQFTAHCQRLSYAEAKDLLVLEGDGRSDAELTHRQYAGSPDSRAAARKILYWRTANRVEVDDARFLDLTQLIQQGRQQKPPKK